MRIVFFGSPPAALPSLGKLLEDGHTVDAVITQPDKPAGRGRKIISSAVKAYALERGLQVLEPERIRKDESVLEKLKAIGADIHIVVAYGQIIPSSMISLPRYRSLNVHFSLLPKYRGASPVQWALLNGESKTGVTIFELNEKMDEGDILAMEETDIRTGETSLQLETRLAHIGANLLAQTLREIGRIKPVPQDHALATPAPKIRKEDGLIDWSQEAALIDRKVRAFHPWPAAFTFFKGRRINLRRGRPLGAGRASSTPGEIVSVGRLGLDVACGAGTVYRIEDLQPEGKKEMKAFAFSLGTEIRPGDRFRE